MEQINTFAIQFFIRKHRGKDGNAPIYVRITVNKRCSEISIKQKVEIESWDSNLGQVKKKCTNSVKINSFIDHIRAQLVTCYQDLLITKSGITSETIKNKFLGIEENGKTLNGLIEYHNTNMQDTLKWGTLKNYRTTAIYLNKFIKTTKKRSDINLSELNYKFITEFEFFLRKYQPTDHHKPMGNNAVMKHLERLRKMVTMAYRMEWIDKDPFIAYKLHFKKSERCYLSEKELADIECKEFRIDRLQFVKDLFVFSCYTGLSYIDVIQLTPDNIRMGIDGGNWIITQREKTSTSVKIPLLNNAKQIIEKYKNNPRAVNKGTLFPAITNQKLNSYLKEIADLCNIEKTLTYHVARHTFATTVTLTNGVPIESVSKMLGHTSLKTTQIYAKVIEKKVSNDMAHLQDVLNDKNKERQKMKQL